MRILLATNAVAAQDSLRSDGDAGAVSVVHTLTPLEGGFGADIVGAPVPEIHLQTYASVPSEQLLADGLASVQNGFLDEAIKQFKEVLNRQPENVVARNNLAVCLKRQGQLDQAISNFKTALDSEPLKAELHNNLATALMAKGDLPEAMKSFYSALRLRPDYPEAHYNLAHLLSLQGNNNSAVTEFEEALKYKNDNPAYYRDFGDALSALGRSDDALMEYEAAARLGDHTDELKPEGGGR